MTYIVEKQFLDEQSVDYGKVIFYAEFQLKKEAEDFASLYNKYESYNGSVFTIRSQSEHSIETRTQKIEKWIDKRTGVIKDIKNLSREELLEVIEYMTPFYIKGSNPTIIYKRS